MGDAWRNRNTSVPKGPEVDRSVPDVVAPPDQTGQEQWDKLTGGQ